MKPRSLTALPLITLPILLAQVFSACSSDNNPAAGPPAASTSSPSSGEGGAGGMGGAGGGMPMPSALCQTQSLPARPFSAGPYGVHRGEIADDFTLPLADGT